MKNMRSPFLKKAVALALAEVMAISSMLWAAPPQPRYAGLECEVVKGDSD